MLLKLFHGNTHQQICAQQLFEIRSYREYSYECGVRDECEVFVVRSEGVGYEALYMLFLVIVLHIVQDKHTILTLCDAFCLCTCAVLSLLSLSVS